MACGSCGGRALRQQQAARAGNGARTRYVARYVWKWVSQDQSESKTFDTQTEADAWMADHPGSLSVVDANAM